MPITPDTKNWTWVLERVCPECGFDTRAFPREQLAEMIRSNATTWVELLQSPDVATRPSDDVWSGLEYACHVRDVFRLYDKRLQMMLEKDDPTYPNWDQNAVALELHYESQNPSTVANELEAAATSLASRFDQVREVQWDRTGLRSDGERFTIESFGRYLIHDPVHHVYDVRRGYAQLRAR